METYIKGYLGKEPNLDNLAFIAPGVVIVGDVSIGIDSSIWYGVVIRGDVHTVKIGSRVNVQDGAVIHVSHDGRGTNIGDGVTIGHKALLHDCRIEMGAFIGMSATLLDGAVVERNAMIAAGALVSPNKRIPSGQLWGGIPASYMRNLTETEIEGFKESADNYVRYAHNHRKLYE